MRQRAYMRSLLFVMPGELLSSAAQAKGKRAYTVQAADGDLTKSGLRSWRWRALDQSVLYRLQIARGKSRETMRLNAFVTLPASHMEYGHLNGYGIGAYADRLLRGLSSYRKPKGFIEVTNKTKNVFLIPHFELRQFLCKQKGDFAKYVVLREELLLKLELILETLNGNGYHRSTLNAMNGNRMPHYNCSLGNVQYSRYLWGNVADIFIDEHPRGGDDPDPGGVMDPEDAAVLYKLIESVEQNPAWWRLGDGLTIYRSNASHGPFVHIDCRGQSVRRGVSPDLPEETVFLRPLERDATRSTSPHRDS